MIIVEFASCIFAAFVVWYICQIVRAKIAYRKFKKINGRRYHY
jgi:hypothetical protein